MLAVVLTAVFIFRTPVAAIVGTVVGAGIVFLPALKLMFSACNVGSLLPSTSGMWSQLKYAVPLGLASIIGTVSKLLDKMIVSSMCSPEQFAVYVNGAIEIPLIGVLTGSVMAILIPDLVKMYKAAQYGELKVLWHRAMVKCSLLILPIMVFLLAMAPEVIRLLFSDRYMESVHPFRVYLLALPVRITHFGAIFMAARRNKLIVYRAMTGLILNLFLSIVLIQVFGSIGAAVSTVLIVYLWTVPYNLFFISRILTVNFRSIIPVSILTKVLIVSIGSGAVFLLAPFVRPLGDVLTLAIMGLLYAIVVMLFFVFFNLADMNRMLSFARRLLRRG
jgi:O-antigen/teichoic acid export membrane protein